MAEDKSSSLLNLLINLLAGWGGYAELELTTIVMLEKQINNNFLTAYKLKDELTVSTLRMIKSALANKKIEKLIAKEELLPDEEVLTVLKSEVKKRLDSIQSYQAGNRQDLAEIEQKELEIINKFLPEQLSEEAIRAAVKKVLADLGNLGLAGFGKIMGAVMAETKGAADGTIVSKIVKEELAGL